MNQLYHYGMPRRSGRYPWGSGARPYQGSSFNDIKRIAKSNIKKDAYVRGYEEGGVSSKDKFYEDLSHDRVIKKNSIAYRTSSVKKETNSGGTYVSFDDNSVFNYASWVSVDGSKGYVTKYKLKKDVKVPSVQKMCEILIDSIMENSETYNKSLDEYMTRRGLESLEKRKEISTKIIDNPNEALVNMYSSFLKGSSKSSGVLGDKIHRKLRDAGYDAVPDLNDVSKNYRTSLFVFDRSNVLEEVSKRDLSKVGLPSRFDEKYNVKYTE